MTHSHLQASQDQRVQHTRMALFQAFSCLVLERNYDDIRISDIIEKAGISRSTFYQHYRNKDDILAGSMAAMFEVLADAANGQGDRETLVVVLAHWWENRTLGRIILNGPAYRRLARELTTMVQQRLKRARRIDAAPEGFNPRAVQLAEGQLATVRAWLSGEIKCQPENLATVLLPPNTSGQVKI